MRPSISRFAPALLTALLLAGSAAAAVDLALPVRFRSFVVNLWNGRSGTMDVLITQWSPQATAGQLASAVDDKGLDAAVDVMEKLPKVGTLEVPGYLGLDVQYTRLLPAPENASQILVVALRRMRFGEMVNGTLSTQYPLTVVELEIKADGQGTGVLYPVARINYWDLKSQIVSVDSLTQPVSLPSVELQPHK